MILVSQSLFRNRRLCNCSGLQVAVYVVCTAFELGTLGNITILSMDQREINILDSNPTSDDIIHLLYVITFNRNSVVQISVRAPSGTSASGLRCKLTIEFNLFSTCSAITSIHPAVTFQNCNHLCFCDEPHTCHMFMTIIRYNIPIRNIKASVRASIFTKPTRFALYRSLVCGYTFTSVRRTI